MNIDFEIPNSHVVIESPIYLESTCNPLDDEPHETTAETSTSLFSFNVSSISLDNTIVNEIFAERDQLLEPLRLLEVPEDVHECINRLLTHVQYNSQGKKALTRKRSVNKEKWGKEKRKRAQQSGEAYVNSRGKYVEAKSIKIKKDSKSNCKFKCSEKISRVMQEHIFDDFYKMDVNDKHAFINKTTVCTGVANTKKNVESTEELNFRSRKKKSYSFYLIEGENSARVCKEFYLSTLAISQKMVYNVHEKKESVSGATKPDGWGKHGKQSRVSDVNRQKVVDHINYFPVIDSHYCRARTNKKYLDPD